jgi:hypothetical protein
MFNTPNIYRRKSKSFASRTTRYLNGLLLGLYFIASTPDDDTGLSPESYLGGPKARFGKREAQGHFCNPRSAKVEMSRKFHVLHPYPDWEPKAWNHAQIGVALFAPAPAPRNTVRPFQSNHHTCTSQTASPPTLHRSTVHGFDRYASARFCC